jgi:hypothetical protein
VHVDDLVGGEARYGNLAVRKLLTEGLIDHLLLVAALPGLRCGGLLGLARG